MNKVILTLTISFLGFASVLAQKTRLWTESDRRYLLDNLIRSRDSILIETQYLTKKQWNFKESPDRWSIKEVVEHLAFYELIYEKEISLAVNTGPQPELNKTAKPDSFYLDFIMEEKPHITTDYTKPFTFSVPMGLNEGKNNVAWFVKMRNESIGYLDTATIDLRSCYMRPGRPNIHQVYINVFGHTDRHLRQIVATDSIMHQVTDSKVHHFSRL
jgi:hypothetical protein